MKIAASPGARRKSGWPQAARTPKHTGSNAAPLRRPGPRSASRVHPRREFNAKHPCGVLTEHLEGHPTGRRREALDGFGHRSREMAIEMREVRCPEEYVLADEVQERHERALVALHRDEALARENLARRGHDQAVTAPREACLHAIDPGRDPRRVTLHEGEL